MKDVPANLADEDDVPECLRTKLAPSGRFAKIFVILVLAAGFGVAVPIILWSGILGDLLTFDLVKHDSVPTTPEWFQAQRDTGGGIEWLNGEIVSLRVQAVPRNEDWFAHLEDLKSLKSLHLGKVGVRDDDLFHLRHLTELIVLDLSGNSIQGPGLQYVGRLKSLQSLNLDGTAIDDASLVHLKSLSSLKTLRLDSGKLTGARLSRLQKDLPNCRIENLTLRRYDGSN